VISTLRCICAIIEANILMAIRPARQGYADGFSKPPAPALYRRIAYSFFAVTVLVVIGALWVSSVRARINVKVRRDTTAVQAVVDIAKSPDQGQLRGRVLRGTFEKIQEFSVKDTPQAAEIPTIVSGTVKVTNNYSKPQTLVKTTRLQTSDGRLYRIDKTITIEPRQVVTVTAHSDQMGKQYVLAAGTHLNIPGLWSEVQKWIYAESVSGFSGGTQTGKVVSSLDVTDAQQALQSAVFEQAQKTLAAEAGSTDDWAVVYSQKVLDSKSNVSPGQQSDQFLASVKLEVTGVFYPKRDMEALIRQKLKERLPDGRDLVDFDSSQVIMKIEQSDPILEKAHLSLSARAGSRLTDSSPALSKDVIAGLSIEEAKAKLRAIDGIDSVDIQIAPAWIGKIPTMKDHITLNIQ